MTAGKRQPPLWLEMDFAEALVRFADTDPKEIVAGPEKKAAALPGAAAAGVKGKAKPGRKRLVQPPAKDAEPQ